MLRVDTTEGMMRPANSSAGTSHPDLSASSTGITFGDSALRFPAAAAVFQPVSALRLHFAEAPAAAADDHAGGSDAARPLDLHLLWGDCIPHPCSRGKARGRLEPAAPRESKAPAQRHAFKGDGEGP